MSPLRAQSTADQAANTQPRTPQWQIDASGQLKFDVASVKQNKSGEPPSGDQPKSNIPLGGGAYTPTGGLFSAVNWPLLNYISFAYKMTGGQFQLLRPQLPKWTNADRFDIEARTAISNPTEDQMRLMMQSLLADRFRLAIHTETRQLPVFGLVLEKPGKLGAQLQPHSDDPPCASASPQPTGDGRFPTTCGGIVGMTASAPGRLRLGARDVTMAQIASTFGGYRNLDRPVLDQTGLTGTFDFSIEWTPQLDDPPQPSTTLQPDDSGLTFLEALKDQLGLKLESITGPVDVLVLDHIEEPSAN